MLLAALLRAPGPSDAGPTGDPGQAPLPLRVDWTVEPSCPDAEALRAELVRLLHRELRFDSDAEARVEGVIRRRAGSFELALSVSAGALHERRTLSAERCEEFRTAAALVVAVALEPWAAGVTRPSVPEPEDPPADTPTPPAPTTDANPSPGLATTDSERDPLAETTPLALPEPDADVALVSEPGPRGSPPPRRRGRVGLLVHGGLGVAQVASVSGGLGGALAYLGRAWRIELTAIHWWPTPVSSAAGTSVGARLMAGGMRGCWTPGRGRWELLVCGGVEAGAMRARSTGAGVTSITSTGPWLGLLAGAGTAWRATGWLALHASVDLTVAAWRPAFHLLVGPSTVPVLTPPPVGARVLAGVELRLPPRIE